MKRTIAIVLLGLGATSLAIADTPTVQQRTKAGSAAPERVELDELVLHGHLLLPEPVLIDGRPPLPKQRRARLPKRFAPRILDGPTATGGRR